MLYDVRTYTCLPGKIKKHLAMYAENGFDIQRGHLGDPLVYLQTETGDVNSYTHIWVYQDAADRTRRRNALQADPAWVNYMAMRCEAGYLISQTNRLMTPVSFYSPKA